MPFKRVAIDLIDPMISTSDKKHRYTLTLVDYATRYPEVVPLKNIDTETIAEALIDLYSRFGIPEEAFSNSELSLCRNACKKCLAYCLSYASQRHLITQSATDLRKNLMGL